MSEEELKVDGKGELEILIAHEGHKSRIEDGVHRMTTKLLINIVHSRLELEPLKKIVKAQHYTNRVIWKLLVLVKKISNFANLTIVSQLATTCSWV